MPEIKDKRDESISTKYSMKIYHEEMNVSGFLHMRMRRIRDIMRAWKAEKEKQERDCPENQATNR